MSNVANNLVGGCHCKNVRYRLVSPISEMYLCHCRDCQILSGSGFHGLGVVQRNDIDLLQGELKKYDNSTQSGFVMSRFFCDECSTPVYIQSTRFPDISMVLVTSLDQPNLFFPSFEIWRDSRLTWADARVNTRHYDCGALDDNA